MINFPSALPTKLTIIFDRQPFPTITTAATSLIIYVSNILFRIRQSKTVTTKFLYKPALSNKINLGCNGCGCDSDIYGKCRL